MIIAVVSIVTISGVRSCIVVRERCSCCDRDEFENERTLTILFLLLLLIIIIFVTRWYAAAAIDRRAAYRDGIAKYRIQLQGERCIMQLQACVRPYASTSRSFLILFSSSSSIVSCSSRHASSSSSSRSSHPPSSLPRRHADTLSRRPSRRAERTACAAPSVSQRPASHCTGKNAVS